MHQSELVLVQLNHLFEKLWSGRSCDLTTAAFVRSFASVAPEFGGGEQHDAHEFLMRLLNHLHEELNVLLPCAGSSHEVSVKDSIHRLRSVICTIFQSQQVSNTKCGKCRTTSRYIIAGTKAITVDVSATIHRIQRERRRMVTCARRRPRPQQCQRSASGQQPHASQSLPTFGLGEMLAELVQPTYLRDG